MSPEPKVLKGPYASYAALVSGIQAEEPAAFEQFVKIFYRGLKATVGHRTNWEEQVEDLVQDTIEGTIRSLRRGNLTDPEYLRSYVSAVMNRKIAEYFAGRIEERRLTTTGESDEEDPATVELNPEEQVLLDERRRIMREALARLKDRDREILVRFYLKEQSPAQICLDMGLTPTQFRLRKSRAKAAFGEFGKKALKGKLKPKQAA